MQKNKRTKNLSLEPTHQSPLARNHSHATQQDDETLKSTSSSCVASLHALPVELLARIFTFYKEALDNPLLRYPALLPITHVCHRWRTSAIGHSQLWTSITRGLSLNWIKAFMERSQRMLMDFDIHVAPLLPATTCPPRCDSRIADLLRDRTLCHEDIISLLANFTRVRSLCLTGKYNVILPIVDSLRRLLPVRSFSLCLNDTMSRRRSSFVLPDDLFGGQAPIRRLQLVHLFGDTIHVVAPHWLLRGVTHFTTTGPEPSELLDALRQMSALTYLEHRPCTHYRRPDNLKMDKVDNAPIHMPQLMNLIVVDANFPDDFVLLNQVLLFPAGAKRRLEIRRPDFIYYARRANGLSAVVEAVKGFQHMHFSGVPNNAWFRLWTGNALTSWEESEFCICVQWVELGLCSSYLRPFVTLCDALGTAQVRWLVIDSPFPGLAASFWWTLLRKLPGIEEMELYSASVDALGGAWKINLCPAVLPTLQRVRIVDLERSSEYAIIGDPPARRIVRVQGSAEDDVFVEKEIENMSKGFLRLLQGKGRGPNGYSKRELGRWNGPAW